MWPAALPLPFAAVEAAEANELAAEAALEVRDEAADWPWDATLPTA